MPAPLSDGVFADELLSLPFEHRIEVADEQKAFAARPALVHGHQMSGAVHGVRQLDPVRLEAERVERGGEHPADLAHAGEIHRAAVDVHRALEHGDLVFVVLVHEGADLPFGGDDLRADRCGRERECRGRGDDRDDGAQRRAALHAG